MTPTFYDSPWCVVYGIGVAVGLEGFVALVIIAAVERRQQRRIARNWFARRRSS
jgi:hypothetical protein